MVYRYRFWPQSTPGHVMKPLLFPTLIPVCLPRYKIFLPLVHWKGKTPNWNSKCLVPVTNYPITENH